MIARVGFAGLLIAVAAGCGGGSGGHSMALPNPATLCFDLDCGEVVPLLRIPDAENLLFSDDGRLFVSGGTNVFEVVRTPEGWAALPLSASGCNFTGLAIRAQTLYAGCFDGRLYAAPLSAVDTLNPIAELGIASPNGMTVGPDDALYIVNGPLSPTALPNPKILRVALQAGAPLVVAEIGDWLTSGLIAPNGLQADGATFYFTDAALPALGAVKKLPWTAEGPGPITTLATFLSLPDDLSLLPADDGLYVLAPQFLLGGLRLLGPDGSLVAALPALTFSFPSQARRGQPPLFQPDEILITEKGILSDTVSPIGNQLSVFRPRQPSP